MNTKNQVTKPIVGAVPAFMKSHKGGAGTELLTADALSPPRLKLAQALSPELETVEGLKAGGFFNSASELVYKDPVRIVPVFLTESYLLFAPRVPGATGGLLARADDGIHWSPPHGTFEVVTNKRGDKATYKMAKTVTLSGLANWGTSDPSDTNSPPAATHCVNCVVMVIAEGGADLLVLSFVRSSLKIGKKFGANLKLSRVPAYGRVFELSSVKVEGPSGPYYEPRLRAAGFVEDEDLFNECHETYKAASDRGVLVDIGENEANSAHAASESAAQAEMKF